MHRSSVLDAYVAGSGAEKGETDDVGAAAARPVAGATPPQCPSAAGNEGLEDAQADKDELWNASAGPTQVQSIPSHAPVEPAAEALPGPNRTGDPTPPPARRPRVLLAVTGSVAAIKTAQLATCLLAFAEVKVAVTRGARAFLEGLELPGSCLPLLDDEGEWRAWHGVGDPVLHIELRRWADVLIIAPLSANTLAKLAAGLCDNLVTCVARAWDFRKPVLLAPAMNTLMWDSPFTARHMHACAGLGMHSIGPIAKRLACGDDGTGAMAEPADIADRGRALLGA
ncbi:COAC1 [Auxenochlorella protothecoides x Auxenochlorella symbiontica]|uniref:phosphopantothenoylcysteine decarboxylase n=1 Tax=Auxenochlorella protothecoides TaxID=3075 RepID=A0A1D2AEC6_AUXPR